MMPQILGEHLLYMNILLWSLWVCQSNLCIYMSPPLCVSLSPPLYILYPPPLSRAMGGFRVTNYRNRKYRDLFKDAISRNNLYITIFTNKGLASCHSLKPVFGKSKYILLSVEWRYRVLKSLTVQNVFIFLYLERN